MSLPVISIGPSGLHLLSAICYLSCASPGGFAEPWVRSPITRVALTCPAEGLAKEEGA